MNTALPSRDITIRPVRASEADTHIELTQLVDLHTPAEELPGLFAALRASLRHEGGPLSHGLHHYLFAESSDGTPVASIHCGPPLWIFHNSAIYPHMRAQLIERVSCIDTIAVHPDYRGRGIASRLLHRAEEDFRNAGFVALTLRHEHDKRHFFTRHGYTTASRLTMILPPVGLVTQANPGWRHAVKPLTDDVSFTTVQGLHAATGFLPV
ncbi:GNAT family N-acetyltransferase [Streptomyces sp. NPDC058371]|uniref:GNAT family N-acetyltransferase n=1 Tax=Streptomyces sp. NPDC058371 TaxID=3346463 RepID=UPI0036696B0C